MGKRANNEGSIYRRSKDGRWVAAVHVGYQNGRRLRRALYARTQADARRLLHDAHAERERGTLAIGERRVTGDYLEWWLENCISGSVRPRTYESYADLVRRHLTPALGATPPSKSDFGNRCSRRGIEQEDNMKRLRFLPWRRIGVLAIVAACALGTSASTITDSSNATASEEYSALSQGVRFSYRPLVGSSDAVIGQYAIDFAHARRMVAAGSTQPEVRLVRPIRRDEFISLGLPYVNYLNPEPPMALVVLRGSFDLRRQVSQHGDGKTPLAGYLGVVFELLYGTPVYWGGSTNGALFRQALNDPSLPDDAPGVPPPVRTLPHPPTPTPRSAPQSNVLRGAPRGAADRLGPNVPGPYSRTPLRPIPTLTVVPTTR